MQGLVSEREGDAKHGTKLNVHFMAQHTVTVWQPTVLLSEVSQRFPAFPPSDLLPTAGTIGQRNHSTP